MSRKFQTILPWALAILLPLSLFVWLVQYILPFRTGDSQLSPTRCFISVLVPSLLIYDAARHKKLDTPAMIVAFCLGFIETISDLSMMATTIAFFLAGTKATKFKRNTKKYDEHDVKSGGKRNWIQVISNGGIGLEIAILGLIEKGPANESPINFHSDYFPSWLSVAFLGSMACACGDTLASELAPALTNTLPRLITNPFRKVPRGTNGGVTMVGFICSALGGFICGLTHYTFIIICVNRDTLLNSPPQWPLLFVGMFGGFFGSLIDSILGATLQFSGQSANKTIVSRKSPGVIRISGLDLLDNHSVNLLSTLVTALVTPYFGRLVWAAI